MPIRKFTVSRDPELYEAWPDVVLTREGNLLAVFSECTHHHDRSYTRIMLTESSDRGRTWSPKRPLTEGTAGKEYYYNCARIAALPDGRLVITVDRVPRGDEKDVSAKSAVLLYFSGDQGRTWSAPAETPLRGIVPDKLTVGAGNRWFIAAHHFQEGHLVQFLRYSDDEGKSWSPRITVADDPRFNLCEVSLLHGGNGLIAAFLRENSGQGLDCMKTVSRDNGEHWGPLVTFPIPGCHRPTAGFLRDGHLLVTCRMRQASHGGDGTWTQNLIAAWSDRDSAFSEEADREWTRILPLDYDRSPFADTGYSGWVQFPDGEICVVNYIVDDAWDKAQIRALSLYPEDIILTERKNAK